jgi:uncharacterized transporter YbjL
MAYMAIIGAAIVVLVLAPIFYAAVFGHDKAKNNLLDLIQAIRGSRTDP